jgi:hypothetical protein
MFCEPKKVQSKQSTHQQNKANRGKKQGWPKNRKLKRSKTPARHQKPRHSKQRGKNSSNPNQIMQSNGLHFHS